MKGRILDVATKHSRTIVLAAVLVALLAAGFAGEAAAHNPAGIAVPGCENGADAVVHNNPNCHP